MATSGPGVLGLAGWSLSHRVRKFTCVLYKSRECILPVQQAKLTQTKTLYISLLLHQQQSAVPSPFVAMAVELAMSSCGTKLH